MPEEYFKTIGNALVDRWDEKEFHRVAHEVLSEFDPPSDFSFETLTQWAIEREELPKQVNFHSGFGSPPLVVFADPKNRFYAEVLVWFPSRTAIHGHGFSGAFRVLSGYSLQCRYRYEGEELCEGLKKGSLNEVGLDFVSPGHTNPIEKDENFIHTVIHMGKPSLTLVVRTPADKSTKYQYEYFRNGLAVASYLRTESQARQVAMLRAFGVVNSEAFQDEVIRYLVGGDLHRLALCGISHLAPELKANPDLLERAREAATKKFGEDASFVFDAFDEGARNQVLWALINGNSRPELQMLTSLRELIPDEKSLHALLEKCYPKQAPGDLLAAWEKHTLKAAGARDAE